MTKIGTINLLIRLTDPSQKVNLEELSREQKAAINFLADSNLISREAPYKPTDLGYELGGQATRTLHHLYGSIIRAKEDASLYRCNSDGSRK